ncbi:MAG: hypothetical protein KatS3mg014_2723 [Actinomycetota bacterium]|nr:MAG: hypothetical protein KatS3mg014_2723 [Actinomycetota bacterium]
MSVPPLELEAIRARWRRARSAAGLLDPTSEGFGSGGLGRYVEPLRVRVLALPPDPETTAIADLDEDFWKWWRSLDPSGLGAPSLGQLLETTPVVDAAVRYRSDGAEPWRWDLYLALHRHGGVDLGLGREATYSYGDPWSQERGEAFRLIAVVGRLWSALAVQSAVLTRFPRSGPLVNRDGAHRHTGDRARACRRGLERASSLPRRRGYVPRAERPHRARGGNVATRWAVPADPGLRTRRSGRGRLGLETAAFPRAVGPASGGTSTSVASTRSRRRWSR